MRLFTLFALGSPPVHHGGRFG